MRPLTSIATSPADRRGALLGHRPAVLWLTGLSGSGKSTLALETEERLLELGILATRLDGDVLRGGISKDLGFSPADRRESVRRAGELALHLAQAGAVVLVAMISPGRRERFDVAQRIAGDGIDFAEVFVSAPLAVCETRDPKGLYRRARLGEIPMFTGVSSPYDRPLGPDLEIRTDLETVENSAARIVELALRLATQRD